MQVKQPHLHQIKLHALLFCSPQMMHRIKFQTKKTWRLKNTINNHFTATKQWVLPSPKLKKTRQYYKLTEN